MLCRQGPSERYAPLGLSFPPLPRRAPPIHEAMGGYAVPTSPAGQSCLDDESFPWLAMPIWHWPEPNKWQMTPRQITMSLDRQNRACKTNQHVTAESFKSAGQSLRFSTLLATAIRHYVLIIRKLSSYKRAKRWHRNGVLAGALSSISACNILTYSIL